MSFSCGRLNEIQRLFLVGARAMRKDSPKALVKPMPGEDWIFADSLFSRDDVRNHQPLAL
jgi:hypothetical protein